MDQALHALKVESPGVEALAQLTVRPPKPEQGTISIPVFRFTPKGKNPAQFAQELAASIQPDSTFTQIKAVGPYINAFANPETMARQALTHASDAPAVPGEGSPWVMIEYASPNTNKPLHLGHVRNIFLAKSVIRLFEHEGTRVMKTQVVNDRGVHICKAMLAYQKWGEGKTPESEHMKPDHFVGKYYNLFAQRAESDEKLEEEALAMLQKWESGDTEVRALWKKMNAWVEKGWSVTFADLGAEFDRNYYESQIYSQGKELVMSAFEKGLFTKAENGAIIIPLEKFGLPDKPVIRGNGTTLYFTQDIYLATSRLKEYPNLEQIIHVVGNEQEMHFKQLFATLQLMGIGDVHKFHHLAYGLLVLPTGKMSSRAGTVINADELIASLVEMAMAEYQKRNPELSDEEIHRRAKVIALGALKFFILRQDAKREIVFHPEESLSFDGQTGPYLLYANARLNSIMRKSEQKPSLEKCGLLTDKREVELLTLLSKKGEIMKDALAHYSPHILSNYLLELANTFNTYYHETKIIQENVELEQARLALVKSIQDVLEEGLFVLGIETLREM